MKKHIFLIALFFALFLSFAQLSVSGTLASGELKTVNQDGVLSLTTTPASTAGLPASSAANLSATGRNVNVQIGAPNGFAQDIGSVVNFSLQAIMIVCIILVFVFLIWGGLEWITSGGEKTKTESARNKIVSAIVGLIVVASSYAVFVLILHLFGFSDLNDVFNHVNPINSATPSGQVATSSSQIRQQQLVK
jgi:hypothetical protein